VVRKMVGDVKGFYRLHYVAYYDLPLAPGFDPIPKSQNVPSLVRMPWAKNISTAESVQAG
jgi:hypothetical protein